MPSSLPALLLFTLLIPCDFLFTLPCLFHCSLLVDYSRLGKGILLLSYTGTR